MENTYTSVSSPIFLLLGDKLLDKSFRNWIIECLYLSNQTKFQTVKEYNVKEGSCGKPNKSECVPLPFGTTIIAARVVV